MQERRRAERIRLDLPVRWESLLTEGRGSICDLSASGCFVLSAGYLKVSELVRLEINFGINRVFLWAEVVYGVPEMGFALRFLLSEASERRALTNLIENLQKSIVDSVPTVS